MTYILRKSNKLIMVYIVYMRVESVWELSLLKYIKHICIIVSFGTFHLYIIDAIVYAIRNRNKEHVNVLPHCKPSKLIAKMAAILAGVPQ